MLQVFGSQMQILPLRDYKKNESDRDLFFNFILTFIQQESSNIEQCIVWY